MASKSHSQKGSPIGLKLNDQGDIVLMVGEKKHEVMLIYTRRFVDLQSGAVTRFFHAVKELPGQVFTAIGSVKQIGNQLHVTIEPIE